jgi:hypothetical protein
MTDSATLDRLNKRLAELERRVAALELGREPLPAEPLLAENPAPLLPALTQAQESGIFPVLGRALLGIAGAYLLRAVAESHWLPSALLAPLAILYALAWMAWSARVAQAAARAVYAATSILILAPMLWELSTSFHTLPGWAGALALAAMVVLAFVMASSPERVIVLRIANLAAAALALALAVATHDNLPFLAVLLFQMAIAEYSANRDRAPGARWPLAFAADLGVWLLIYLYRGPAADHADYPQLSAAALIFPAVILFAITAVSVLWASCRRRVRISVAEMVQTVAAFLLAACALLYFGPASRAFVLGFVCLLLAGILYAILLTVLRASDDWRNSAVFATWSAALFLTASFLAVPASIRPEWLALAALAAALVGVRTKLLALALQGDLYLLTATFVSGLAVYSGQVFIADSPAVPTFAVLFASVCALVGYIVVRSSAAAFAGLTRYVFAAVTVLAIVGLFAQALIALAGLGFHLQVHHLAFIRSFALCAMVLALAYIGARAARPELSSLSYVVVVLEALKLLAQDLRHGQLTWMAASVCLFAVTLLVLPRVRKAGTP